MRTDIMSTSSVPDPAALAEKHSTAASFIDVLGQKIAAGSITLTLLRLQIQKKSADFQCKMAKRPELELFTNGYVNQHANWPCVCDPELHPIGCHGNCRLCGHGGESIAPPVSVSG